MKKQLTFVLNLFVCLSLIVLLLLAGPTAPAGAQESWLGPVQLIYSALSGQSSTFVGPGLQASGSLSGSSQLVGNPGFENGGWSPWQIFGTPTLDSATQHSGSQSAHLGNINNANDQVLQAVTAADNASDIVLDFWYRVDTGETGVGADYFCYGLWDQSGVTALVQRCLDLGGTGNQAWSRETYSLTADERAGVSGQTVLLAFILQTNGAQPSQVWIDDTAENVTTSTLPPPSQHQVFLPLLIRSQSGPPPPPPGGSTNVFWLPYIGGNDILSTYGTSIAVDSAGGIHVGYALYTGLDNGQRPAYYAYCAANCSSLASWSLTRLSNYIQDVRLALDPTGHPRMLLYTSDDPNLEDAYEYQYAACDGGCTSSANWTITGLFTVSQISGRRSYQNNRYFALDPQGRPAFVFSDNDGTFYAYCSGFCTNGANWSEFLIVNNQWPSKPALTFTPTGDPRLLIDYYDSDNIRTRLLYLGCDTLACNNSRGRFLINDVAVSIGDAYFSLRMESSGQPRIALYTGEVVTPPLELTALHYLWCNTDCLNPYTSTWNLVRLSGVPTYQGDGVDLVLDPANRPRLAYQKGDVGLGYAWCDTNCESASGWQTHTLESTAAIEAKYPPGLPQYEDCLILTWLNGVRPSLALDPAGNPRVGYDAELWWGGTSPYITCDIDVPVARFGLFDQP